MSAKVLQTTNTLTQAQDDTDAAEVAVQHQDKGTHITVNGILLTFII